MPNRATLGGVVMMMKIMIITAMLMIIKTYSILIMKMEIITITPTIIMLMTCCYRIGRVRSILWNLMEYPETSRAAQVYLVSTHILDSCQVFNCETQAE